MQTFLSVDSVCIAKIYSIKIRPQNIPTMQFDWHNPWLSLSRNLKVANKDLRHSIGY